MEPKSTQVCRFFANSVDEFTDERHILTEPELVGYSKDHESYLLLVLGRKGDRVLVDASGVPLGGCVVNGESKILIKLKSGKVITLVHGAPTDCDERRHLMATITPQQQRQLAGQPVAMFRMEGAKKNINFRPIVGTTKAVQPGSTFFQRNLPCVQ